MKRNKSLLVFGVVALGLSGVVLYDNHHAVEKKIVDAEKVLQRKGGLSPYSFMPLRSVSGNYLAARFAVGNDDLHAANLYYNRALGSAIKPAAQQFLSERALPAAIGSGDIKGALKITSSMDMTMPTATAQLGVMLQIVEGFKKNDTATVDKLMPSLRNDGFGRLLKPLLQAWALVGEEKPEQAIALLQKLAKEYPSLKPMTQMHLAFVYDMLGMNDKAEMNYRLSQSDHLSVRSAYLIGKFYEHQGRKADAIQVYKKLDTQLEDASLPQIVLARLEKGDLEKNSFIQKPSDGVAAAFYDVATVLHQENSSRLAILYAQMAHYLAPQDEFTTVLLGDILMNTNVDSQAEQYYKSIGKNSDLFILSQQRLAQLYQQQDRFDKAIDILEKVEKNPYAKNQGLMALGDLYRQKEDFAQAIPYYTRLLDNTPKKTANDWVIYYARGICYERNGEWEKAEADLLQSLKLSPQQPEVLNYLAYSWADHGKNLAKSLEMLQKALAGAPDDPYIADSVGWALYKIGHVDQALPYLEAAIQSLPDDATINSHLGDVYWAAGRRLEAQFQWERALKNAKDTEVKLRADLRNRLENGLPETAMPVLKNENAVTKN